MTTPDEATATARKNLGEDIDAAKRAAKDAAERVKHEATPENARRQAAHIADMAREKAGAYAESGKQSLAHQANEVAGVLHSAADDFDRREQPSMASLTHNVADGVERFAETMRARTVGEMVGHAEDLARRQPAIFIGGAALLGFLAVRFLKSSANRGGGHDEPRESREYSADGGANSPAA